MAEAPPRFALGLLRAGILAYRRWASGRGPLSRVRCSFEQTESCSAFGLRVSREAPSAGVALHLIRGRLRACGDACVHVDRSESGRERVFWGPLYDRLHEPAQAKLLAWELPQTLEALSRVESVVQRPGAVRLESPELARRLGAPRILLRAGRGDASRLRRFHITVWSWSVLVLGVTLASSQGRWLWPLVGLVCCLGARATWRAWRRMDAWRERRAELLASASFEVFRLE